MKHCKRCQTDKPQSEFAPDSRTKDGLVYACRTCMSDYKAAYRAAHGDRLRALDRARPVDLDKARQGSRDHYTRNKPEILERQRVYRDAHRSERRAAQRASYLVAANRARECAKAAYATGSTLTAASRGSQARKQYLAEWAEKNKTKRAAAEAERRARRRQATPAWADAPSLTEVYLCARTASAQDGRPYHVDHLVPLNGLTVCGLHVVANLAVVPGVANLSKANRFWPDQP